MTGIGESSSFERFTTLRAKHLAEQRKQNEVPSFTVDFRKPAPSLLETTPTPPPEPRPPVLLVHLQLVPPTISPSLQLDLANSQLMLLNPNGTVRETWALSELGAPMVGPAKVFLANSPDHSASMVVKWIPVELRSSADAPYEVQLQKSDLATGISPKIHFHEFDRASKGHWMAMEALTALCGSLDSLLTSSDDLISTQDSSNSTSKGIKKVLLGAISVTEKLHCRGAAFGDVRPENFGYGTSRVKGMRFLDWETVVGGDPFRSPAVLKASPLYQSPEITQYLARNAPLKSWSLEHMDMLKRSDQWALATMVFSQLMGRFPTWSTQFGQRHIEHDRVVAEIGNLRIQLGSSLLEGDVVTSEATLEAAILNDPATATLYCFVRDVFLEALSVVPASPSADGDRGRHLGESLS